MRSPSRRAAAVLGAALAIVSSGSALAGPGDPPGNNGTVKVDEQPFDVQPNNEPHVGCVFQVDFYGFDEGAYFADVLFEAKPPSGRAVLLTDRVFIGQDDHSGGGSADGLDAQRTYDLTVPVAALRQHPGQGYHVKLTIQADGSQGADVKHKVFWVTGCETPPSSPPPSSPPPGYGS